MAESQLKRKQGPGASNGSSTNKKRKEGAAGRWKTPIQKARHAEKLEMGTAIDVEDEGIWVTYARGMKGKAVREFKTLCEEYGEKMYGIKAPADEEEKREDGLPGQEDNDNDIESSIQWEINEMKAHHQRAPVRETFSPVSVGIECVFFMKTMKPVEPTQLVLRICEDARECPDPRQRKCRYINRLTPVTDTGKATEKGIKRVARKVLASWFSLNEEIEASSSMERKKDLDEDTKTAPSTTKSQLAETPPALTYAIRHSIRNHTTFKSDAVIKMIAQMIKPEHKVNLTNPDKVILVEIFQLFCGISVVDGRRWEELKRYNMNGLYGMTVEQKSGGR